MKCNIIIINGCEGCVSIGGDGMSVDVLAVKFGQEIAR